MSSLPRAARMQPDTGRSMPTARFRSKSLAEAIGFHKNGVCPGRVDWRNFGLLGRLFILQWWIYGDQLSR